jgi:hypothetical protein
MPAWWWPDPANMCFWPEGAPRVTTLAAFVRAFEEIGYKVCDGADAEKGFEKVAIYAKDGVPTHAARQITNGRWTRKLGAWETIEHDFDALEGSEYGHVAYVLRRRRRRS